MKRNTVLFSALLSAVLVLASSARAQEGVLHHDFSVQGNGFFTKDSQHNGTLQHSTDTGGFLVSYRLHFTGWLAAEASYGYARSTQQTFTPGNAFAIQSNVHQATGALVVDLPLYAARFQPYVLAGAGALVFDPTDNTGVSVAGAQRQARPTFVYGGGMDYRLFHHVALRLEYRGYVYNRPDFEIGSVRSDVTAHTALPSAGLVFSF
jgi:outer membrane immunogenic protein